MKQLTIYCSYTEHTEEFAKRFLNELRHAVCSTTMIVANMYTDASVELTTLPWLEASIRLYFVSKAALENIGLYQEIRMLLENDDKSDNVFFLSSSSLGARLSYKDNIKFYVSQTCYDASMFINRYRLYSLIYERLYGKPKQHSYLVDPAEKYWHAMWVLSCHLDRLEDLIPAQRLLEESAAASNLYALNYTGYSLCCGVIPFNVEEHRGIKLMMKAADLGHPIARLNIGKWLFQRGKYQKAIALLRVGVSEVNDDGGGYSLLSQCYAEGLGVSKNFSKAERYALLSKTLKIRSRFKDSISSNQLFRNLAINSEIRF
jgi:TPR repeat protein